MKRRINLMAAPTAIQPGDYVVAAYADATRALTPFVNLDLEKSSLGWRATLAWHCPEPVKDIRGDTNRFADAAALLVPVRPDTAMISMGAEGYPVEGFLWRADWQTPKTIRAEGFGTVERLDAPKGWRALGEWQSRTWLVRFEMPSWPALEQQMKLGVAVWQGARAQRAGLKSVSPDWIEVRL